MTPIDLYAVEPHFVDHLAPIWLALRKEARGTFALDGKARRGFTHEDLLARAAAHGITPGTLGPEDRPIVVAANGDMAQARKAGRTRIALLEHGTGQSFGGDREPQVARHASYPGGMNRDAASLFLSPNAHAAGRDHAAYPKARVEIVGCPKLDAVPARRPRANKPVVAISFHWDANICAETRSGWREWKRTLPFLAQQDDFTLIGHGHPRILPELVPHYRTHRIEVVRDFAEVLARADVYVNEGSSTLYEAAAAGLRVVVLNPSFFRPGVRHGLRFYDAADVGPNVRARNNVDTSLAKKTIAAIRLAIADPAEVRAARETAIDIMYAFRSGAAQRAADVLVDWAADRSARKAAA